MKNPERNPKYFVTPLAHVAVIGKSGSSAIGKVLMKEIHQDICPHFVGADNGNRPGWQQFVPKTETPDAPLIPVREPVERFRSACAQSRITVDEALDKLEAGERLATSFHFRPTSDYVVAGSRLYQFPEHVAELAAAIGLTGIPPVNDNASNNPPKPDLTPEQLVRVRKIYASDIALYGSILEPGQVV